MAKLPLSDAILRLLGNEERFDTFTHGRDTDSYLTRLGETVPSLRKFLKDVREDIIADQSGVVEADQALAPQLLTVYTRPRSSRYAGTYPRNGVFEAWCASYKPNRDIDVPGSFVTWLVGAGFPGQEIVRMQLDVYEVAASNLPSSVPGSGTLFYRGFYNISDIMEDKPRTDYAQRVELPLSGAGRYRQGYAYMHVMYCEMAGNVSTSFGVGQANARAEPDYGWVRVNNNWGGVTGQQIAFEIRELTLQPDDEHNYLGSAKLEHVASVGSLSLEWPGLSVLVPELRIERGRANNVIASSDPGRLNLLTFGAPGSITKTMRYPVQAAALALSHEYVRNVTVRRVSDNVLLTENVDYVVNYARGDISNPNAGSGFVECDITFTADNTRYDAIWIDPQTGDFGTTPGVERGKDVVEFIPNIPLGMLRVYNAYVTAANGISLAPTYTHRNGVPIGREGEYLAWLNEMRTRLPKLFKKIRLGQPITICQVGDSIQAIGGQSPSQYTTPNGPSRDNREIYFGGTGVGDDFLASLPVVNGKMQIGWVWHLKAAIESVSGSVVTIQNLAVGGSNTGQTVPGGNSPEMLAAYQATNADLFLTNFGMNSAGDNNFFLQTVSLFRTLRNYGGEIIDMMIPLTPAIGGIMDTSEWFELNNLKVRAAQIVNDEMNGVAYVPAALVCHPDHLGSMGMARETLCDAGKKNHSGQAEFAVYGKFLSNIVLGA